MAANEAYIHLTLCLLSVLSITWCFEQCLVEDTTLNCTLSGLIEVPDSWNETNYVTVDLSRNDISQITPFPESKTIQKIILQHNNISEIENKAFAQLINLKTIDLSFNYLTYTSLSALIFKGNDNIGEYDPIYVEILFLSHNVIHALSPQVFEHLPNLTELYLNNNPFNTLDPVTILAITNAKRSLKLLDLSYCGLDTIPEGFLHTLSQLTTLNLDGNQFTVIPGALTEASKSLIFLNLSDNPLENVTFPEMKMLEELTMNAVDTVSVIPSGAFQLLSSLKVLRCNDNPMLKEIQENIFNKENQNMRKLELRNDALENIPENLGVDWQRLNMLDLRGNPWNCDCSLAWFADRVMPEIVNKNPQHVTDLKCATPSVVEGVPLVQMPLRACLNADYTRRRVTALLSFLILLTVCSAVLLTAQWAQRRRHPPLLHGSLNDADEGEDVVHYVRIVESKD